MVKVIGAAGCLLLLALSPSSAYAAPKRPQAAPATNRMIDALGACRALTDAAARLACFDEASARLAQAVESKEVVVLDRQEIGETRRSLFGFSLPRIPLFRGEGGEQQSEITAKISSGQALGHGLYQIRIEDGAVWQTTETYMSLSEPRVGQEVVIKRGPLGSYMMRINGQRAIRAKRVG
jgi:hypothetical protein